MRNRPRPPMPMLAAIVAVAMICSVAERSPEKISGSAQGTSTLASTCVPRHAHAPGGVTRGRVDALDPGVAPDRIGGTARITRTTRVGTTYAASP